MKAGIVGIGAVSGVVGVQRRGQRRCPVRQLSRHREGSKDRANSIRILNGAD